MATATRALFQSLFQIYRVTPAKRKCIKSSAAVSLAPRRHYSNSPSWYQDERPSDRPSQPRSTRSRDPIAEAPADNEPLPYVDPSSYRTPSTPITADDLDPEDRANFETLSEPKKEEYLGLQNHYIAILEEPDGESRYANAMEDRMVEEIEREAPDEIGRIEKLAPQDIGYWAEEEEDELGLHEDGDDDADESHITAVAEAELELHREIRQYTRIAAWDMPLLTSTTLLAPKQDIR
jgi:hypothetical protein